MSDDFDITSLQNTLSKTQYKKLQQAYVKDADLDIHIPRAGDSLGLEKTHQFKEIMAQYLEDVNTLQHDADAQIQRFVAGETDNLHEVTQAMEEADVSFNLMMQLRNKLVTAYKEMMNMQI